MIAFAWYLLKVTICSGILFAYYLLALRNRPHHRWNRFYLLAATAVSLILPLLRLSFPWEAQASAGNTQWVYLLRVVSDNESFFETADASGTYRHIAWMPLVYGLLCIALLLRTALPYLRLRVSLRSAEIQSFGKVKLVGSNDEKAPFTLFNYIFWNEKLDLREPAARQVLEHEMVHVREHHSLDKLFLNICLIVCWPVPFFWLIRRELGMVHEFIADEASVEGRDSRAFAAMVLRAAYPGHPLDLTNSFFQSPIKRRLLMLVKKHSQNAGRIGRWMALPLLVILSAAFVLRPTPIDPKATSTAPKKKITVVIDAGHGGSDQGVAIADGTREKDITLAIARRIRDLNTNDSVSILLTRSNDETMDVRQRVAFARTNRADLYLSIHVNAQPAGEPTKKGMEMFVSSQNKAMEQANAIFGSILNNELSQVYDVEGVLKKREKSSWVLDAPEVDYPAVLLETGYITNDLDRRFITKSENQDNIAKAILRSLEKYTEGTPPTAIVAGNSSFTNHDAQTLGKADAPMFIVDGKRIPSGTKQADLNKLVDPADIDHINVWKGDSATIKFGPDGKNGVVEITTKAKAKKN